MKRVVRSTPYFLAALLCILPPSLFGDEARTKIDVKKYTINAAINPRTQSIEATAKIDFTPLENANQVTFELNNALNISKAVDATGVVMPTQRDASDFSVRIMFPAWSKISLSLFLSATMANSLAKKTLPSLELPSRR
jgi:hypothetical protein